MIPDKQGKKYLESLVLVRPEEEEEMIAGENRSPANPEGGAGRIRSWGNDVCPFSAFSVTTPNVRGRIGTEIERDDSPNLASRGREIHRRGDSEGGGREVEERSIRRRRQ